MISVLNTCSPVHGGTIESSGQNPFHFSHSVIHMVMEALMKKDESKGCFKQLCSCQLA